MGVCASAVDYLVARHIREGMMNRSYSTNAKNNQKRFLEQFGYAESDPQWAAARRVVCRLETYSQVIFVSGNAVRHGLALIERVRPGGLAATTCYAIGQTTARLLAEAGIVALHADGPRMNSEEAKRSLG